MDWCEVCEEVSPHPKICEVCGEDLVARPAGAGGDGGGASAAVAAASDASTSAAATSAMSREEAGAILTAVEAHRATTTAAVAAGASAGSSASDLASQWDAQNQAVLLEAVRAATGAASVSRAGAGLGGLGDEWQTPPPEAMDPSAAHRRDRPTSSECIERIPRIVVGPNSAILHESTVTVQPPVMCGPLGGCGGSAGNAIKRKVNGYDCIVAEFGPSPPYDRTGRLVLCHPTTGKGGFQPTTFASLAANAHYPTIAYMERGDGVTFVRKALMAQSAGASAVVVGNNCGVWPYVMTDSSGEAEKGIALGNLKSTGEKEEEKNGASEGKPKSGGDGDVKKDDAKADGIETLKIPVVMVKRSDGNRIRSVLEKSPGCTTRCTIAAKKVGAASSTSSASESSSFGGCVVCTDAFKVGDTVMRLPFCAHVFHESCALKWLTKHNTCPMCRRELPTDDAEYESRRRAEGRSHAVASSSDSAGLDESQWESLFG